MDKFWELLAESVIIQGVLALSLVGACVYLSVTGQEIPDALEAALMAILGFFFGSKVQQSIHTIRR